MKSTGNDQSQSSASRRMLNPQVVPDFSNPALEWRRMFAEIWGTFLLVLVATGGGVVRDLSGGSLSLAMIVAAPGLMVMAIIYFMGSVSGAHLNPAVTLAFAVRGNFP
jgi:aquaporin Z